MLDRSSPPQVDDGHGGRRRRRVRRASPAELLALLGIALAAAVLAALSAGRPTGIVGADVFFRAAFAFVVTLACSKARRWTWLVLAGGGAIAADPPALRVLLIGAVCVAFYVTVIEPSRLRLLGAAIGALSVQGLLRGIDAGPYGTSALFAAVVVAPVLLSAYARLRGRFRRAVTWSAVGLVVFAVLATAGFGVAALGGRSSMDDAIDQAQKGVDAARAGQQEQAASALEAAATSFEEAQDAFAAPWAQPALLVPIVSQHARTITTVTDSGHDIAATAADAARRAPYRDLRSESGQVNIEVVRSMQRPLADATAAIATAQASVDELDADWLLPAVADPLARFEANLDEARPEADLAAQALAVAPGLLGGDGARQYFIAFGTPAESRFLGGFIGSYGILTADHGKLTLSRSGRIADLNPPYVPDRTLAGPRDYLDRYGRFFPERFFQNVSASPDFPTVAQVITELYQDGGGGPIDGAIYVDPYALAAFLTFTGPVKVEGLPEPLTSANAAEFLVRGQYERFGDTDERTDLLADASRATFDALTKASLPGPEALAKTLGPVVAQGRLLLSVNHQGEQAFLEHLGLTGAFARHSDGDTFAVRTANANPNKIDVFLQRDVTYDATIDPATGVVDATATVRLTNHAPTEGLPDYVLGNRDILEGKDRRPRGSNTMYLSVYTPLRARQGSLDGADLPLEAQSEFGLNVYSTYVTVPAGGTVEVKLHLDGQIALQEGYRLELPSQPTVLPDHVTTHVRTTGGGNGGGSQLVPGPGQPADLGPDQAFDLTEHRELAYAVRPPA